MLIANLRDANMQDPVYEDELEEWKEIFSICVKKLNEKCYRLLHYEMEGYSNEAIGYRLGIHDKKKISDARRYCIRKLREFIVEELKQLKNGK